MSVFLYSKLKTKQRIYHKKDFNKKGNKIMKIWFRVGMEADITQEELERLRSGDEKLMKQVISRGELSGETYIVGKDNGGVDEYDNPNKEISFLI